MVLWFSSITKTFVPCTYGYATTIRRAQGATLHHGCIWFNHCYPAERGYGYVAASRFRSKAGVYLYGKVRASDWLPVGGTEDYEDTRRSELSDCDSYDSESEEATALSLEQDRDGYGDADDSESDSDDPCAAMSEEQHAAYVASRLADQEQLKALFTKVQGSLSEIHRDLEFGLDYLRSGA